MPNLHSKTLIKQPPRHLNVFTQTVLMLELYPYTFKPGSEVGQSKHNFVWLLCGNGI